MSFEHFSYFVNFDFRWLNQLEEKEIKGKDLKQVTNFNPLKKIKLKNRKVGVQQRKSQ